MDKTEKWTGERLETYIYTQDAIDHLHRYAAVRSYVEGKTVLDIASGEGYGSFLMADVAFAVTGVDIDPQSVAGAKVKYKARNLEFLEGRADKIPLADAAVEVVVSFETLEHHDLHDEMFAEVRRVLKPGGLFIISTPDKKYYSDARNFNNRFHVKELYQDEFRNLSARHFSKNQCLAQTYVNGSSLIQDIDQPVISTIFDGNFNGLAQRPVTHMYLLILASDADFVPMPPSLFNGEEISRTEKTRIISSVKSSASFVLGNALLRPFRFLKKTKR